MKKIIIPAVATAVIVAGIVTVAITSEKVLATVNGAKILNETVEMHMKQIPADVIAQNGATIRKNILEKLVERELVMQAATEMNIEENADYQASLSEAVKGIRYTFVMQSKVDSAVNDKAIKAAYANIAGVPAVKGRHILLKTEADAKKVIAKLKKGSSFVKLAKSESTGPSATNGGDLGWFTKESMVPEFSTAAFALKKGKFTTKPVKTSFGWHVILVEDVDANRKAEFKASKEAIRTQLTKQVVAGYIASLKEKAEVTYTN